MLRRGRFRIDDVVFVQCAVPSREGVSQYADERRRIEEMVGRINGEHGTVGHVAVHYIHRNTPFEELVALYRLADVMVVTPYRDGMNLVCKEYVASRLDDTGVLVLSEFAGAARELDRALLVNPHDLDGVSETLELALDLPEAEARRRMRSLRAAVRRRDVFDWARRFLEALRA
jgi:trehalose 6-phosphate synthase